MKKQRVIFNASDNLIKVRPHVSDDQLNDILLKYFGLELDDGVIPKELDSYDDRNFLVQGKLIRRGNAVDHQYQHNGKFVLKIFNSYEACQQSWYENLAKIIVLCYKECASHFKLPLPIYGVDNSGMIMSTDIPLDKGVEVDGNKLSDLPCKSEMITLKDGVYYSRHLVRLSAYIPGKVVDMKTISNELAFDFGKSAALLDLAMKDIPAPDVDVREKWVWNLVNAFQNIYDPHVTSLKDEDKKEMCKEILENFHCRVLPRLKHLPKQWIHGDLNNQNVICCESDEVKAITGIIDFDDLVYSYRVIDLAVSIMYITVTSSQERCLDLAKHLFRGYESLVKLSEVEMDCVYNLMLVRYVQSLCISEYQYTYLDPGNEYLLTTSKMGWENLRYMLSIGEDEFLRKIRD